MQFECVQALFGTTDVIRVAPDVASIIISLRDCNEGICVNTNGGQPITKDLRG